MQLIAGKAHNDYTSDTFSFRYYLLYLWRQVHIYLSQYINLKRQVRLYSLVVGEDVRGGGDHLHGLLGALPHLLHLLLPQPGHCQDTLHLPHLLGFLLAGHVQHMRQPNHLLLDEQTIQVGNKKFNKCLTKIIFI